MGICNSLGSDNLDTQTLVSLTTTRIPLCTIPDPKGLTLAIIDAIVSPEKGEATEVGKEMCIGRLGVGIPQLD
jgi:hypothetical protein